MLSKWGRFGLVTLELSNQDRSGKTEVFRVAQEARQNKRDTAEVNHENMLMVKLYPGRNVDNDIQTGHALVGLTCGNFLFAFFAHASELLTHGVD